MRGRYYVRLLGCDCGREHTMVDPDYFYTTQTAWEVPLAFSKEAVARDEGASFIAWVQSQGSRFADYEVVGIN